MLFWSKPFNVLTWYKSHGFHPIYDLLNLPLQSIPHQSTHSLGWLQLFDISFSSLSWKVSGPPVDLCIYWNTFSLSSIQDNDSAFPNLLEAILSDLCISPSMCSTPYSQQLWGRFPFGYCSHFSDRECLWVSAPLSQGPLTNSSKGEQVCHRWGQL